MLHFSQGFQQLLPAVTFPAGIPGRHTRPAFPAKWDRKKSTDQNKLENYSVPII